jgi:hypothetical protein
VETHEANSYQVGRSHSCDIHDGLASWGNAHGELCRLTGVSTTVAAGASKQTDV